MAGALTRDDILRRYPHLVAHLICHSLGYFSPEGAAGAIQAVIEKRDYACEWYWHMASCGRRSLQEIGRDELARAFRDRHHHRGYMAEYQHARRLVDHVVRTGQGPVFGSWF